MTQFTPEFIREQLALAESAKKEKLPLEWNWEVDTGRQPYPMEAWAETQRYKGETLRDIEPSVKADRLYLEAAAQYFPAALAEIARLAAELARLKAESEWIPVSERLPELPNWVIVHDRYDDVFPAFYNKGYWWEDTQNEVDGDFLTVDLIIEWRPLPAAPRSEK